LLPLLFAIVVVDAADVAAAADCVAR